MWTRAVREKPSREGVKGGWGKGNVGGIKLKEGFSSGVQLDSRQGGLSLSIDNYYCAVSEEL